MYLKELRSEPAGLFETIRFVNGINFIFGKKDSASDPKKSLNGIGKSTTLDLLDFCLLCSAQSNHNSRLHSAKSILSGYKIVLDFEVDNKLFTVKRTIDEPNNVELFLNGAKSEYSLKDAQMLFGDLIFNNPDYEGYYTNKWYRRLITFFLKIQKPKQEKFLDPIQYLKETSVADLNQYHFFLLGINNKFAHNNYQLLAQFKSKEPVISGVKSFIEQTYGLDSISEAQNEVNKINREIQRLEKSVESFKLKEEYKDVEGQANELTSEIKNLWYENFLDRKKIESYSNTDAETEDINLNKVKRIYGEANHLLGQAIKKTLEEAVDFRKQLAKSREEFISQEVSVLQKSIESRENKIEQIEEERVKLFNFLSARQAIKDLTEAFDVISRKRQTLNELEGKVKIYVDLTKEKAELKVEESKLEKEILNFITDIKQETANFSNLFAEIYNNIYPASTEESVFTISEKLNTEAKLEIGISFPSMRSKGKNQGRTLIYDLAVLFNAINKNIRCPRFLVHDGIFDGMDKAHFVALCNYLQSLANKKTRFQYIVTLNEEGTLNDKFGDADRVTPEIIEKEALIVLTPTNKLFGEEF